MNHTERRRRRDYDLRNRIMAVLLEPPCVQHVAGGGRLALPPSVEQRMREHSARVIANRLADELGQSGGGPIGTSE